jgi:RNA polymerase sigma-70 factor (ECF subfamily)
MMNFFKSKVANGNNGETEADDSLISRILNGEKKAYKLIVRRYNDYLYKIGRAYGFGHSDTEDLMQETYVNAYLNLAKFEYRSTFKTWLTRIMLNECYHKKDRQRAKEDQKSDDRMRFANNNNNETGAKVDNNELSQYLEKAILNIPENYRIVFTLRELNGLSVRETSKALGLRESNVKVRLHRGKEMLRDELRNIYNPAEIFEFNLIYCDKMVERVMAAISNKIPGE